MVTVQALEIGVLGSGLRFRVWGLGYSIKGSGSTVQLGSRV